jgi:hypothetical protein
MADKRVSEEQIGGLRFRSGVEGHETIVTRTLLIDDGGADGQTDGVMELQLQQNVLGRCRRSTEKRNVKESVLIKSRFGIVRG